MKIEQCRWTNEKGWEPHAPGQIQEEIHLALVFASRAILSDNQKIKELKNAYPKALLLGCSTAGEIYDTQVTDESIVSTAIHFEYTQIKMTNAKIANIDASFEVGKQLIEGIPHKGLVHVFVLSDGIKINGSELVKGVTENLPQGVAVTGGLSGDGANFQETTVLCNDKTEKDTVALIGFYGERLKIGYGSLGGWDPFGPERLITKSKSNVLYELDGQSALSLYEKYLGDHAKQLPASGLLFPLSLRTPKGDTGVVRTILAIDKDENSMTFAGDMPEGSYAQLMKANFDRLIDGANVAAQRSNQALGSKSPDFAVLISCVGRKMVLKQRIEEEVESVRDVLGDKTVLTGFYSYGEISPFSPDAKCELHNQTMTITTFTEE